MAEDVHNALLEHYRLEPPSSQSPSQGRRHGERWFRVRQIGQGGYGAVYLEKEERSSQARAVKSVFKTREYNVKTELLALTRLAKPAYADYFGRFLGWYEDDVSISYVMEYFKLGDLRPFMRSPFPEAEVRDVIFQLLLGLRVMHNDGFTHRDLKPENIFVLRTSPKWEVKIGDFGVAKRVKDGDTVLRTVIFSRNYTAPEVLDIFDDDDDQEHKEYTSAVDIWSIGILSYELLCSVMPFSEFRALKRFCKSQPQVLPTDSLKERQVTSDGIDFVNSLLRVTPSERPDASSALLSPWLTNEDDPGIEVFEDQSSEPSTDDKAGRTKTDSSEPQNDIPIEESFCRSEKLTTLRKTTAFIRSKLDAAAPSASAHSAPPEIFSEELNSALDTPEDDVESIQDVEWSSDSDFEDSEQLAEGSNKTIVGITKTKPKAPKTLLDTEKSTIAQWFRVKRVEIESNIKIERIAQRAPESLIEHPIFGEKLLEALETAYVRGVYHDEAGKQFTYGIVPVVVVECGKFIAKEGPKAYNVFEQPGDTAHVAQLIVKFSNPLSFGYGCDWTGFTVHDAASVLLKYLGELPQPLIIPKVAKKLESVCQEALRSNASLPDTVAISDLCAELPHPNRYLLVYIVKLLGAFVSIQYKNNGPLRKLASIGKFASIFYPVFLGPKITVRFRTLIVHHLIINCDALSNELIRRDNGSHIE